MPDHEQSPLAQSRARRLERKWFAALGVFSAAVFCVNLNWFAARSYARWDVTPDRLYTLSEPTLDALARVDSAVSFTVLLSRGDPLYTSVRLLLSHYSAKNSLVTARYLDPDQNPAEFMAVLQKYGVNAGNTQDGRMVTDSALIVAKADQHWFIAPDDLSRLDDESGRARPQMEQAFTEAILRLENPERLRVCFVKGQREFDPEDPSPEGLSDFKQRLEKNNFETQILPWADAPLSAKTCNLLIIAGPALPFSKPDNDVLRDYFRQGGAVFLLLGPTLDEGDAFRASGLEGFLTPLGIELGKDLVLEQNPKQRSPRGQGETFFATLEAHPVMRGLLGKNAADELRVLVSMSQSLSSKSPNVSPLLTSSETAFKIDQVKILQDSKRLDETRAQASSQKFSLALALESPPVTGAKGGKVPRLVVVGTSSLAKNRNFREPGLFGNRVFLENATSWLVARPALASVPEKEARELELNLTEESLGEVRRYVLIYMPGSLALLGIFVWLRRRNVEKASRKEQSA